MLIHDSKLPCSFNSGRWHNGYNPDLVFVTDCISLMSVKEIGSGNFNTNSQAQAHHFQAPNSQHRPII